MHISDLDTPALIIDLDVFEQNLRKVQLYADRHGLRMRPHTKTHKSPDVARQQLALGAAGLTVAKVGEAEVLAGALARTAPFDLLVAFPVIGARKLERLVRVARQTPVTVALDSEAAARPLSDAAQAGGVEIGVLVEIDLGMGRVGVVPGPEAVNLARLIEELPGLRFRGITFYPGQIREPDGEDAPKIPELGRLLHGLLEEFARAGLEVSIVSGGSTPTLYHSHLIKGLNEIRPGTYVFNDLNTVLTGACTLAECAATVLVTVVSAPRHGHAIVDGGSKTFSSDRPNDGTVSFGRVVGSPECVFHKMNEEHGFLDTTRAKREFKVGDRLRIIPNHVCVAVNLHEYAYGVRGETVERNWKVEGRGKLQ